MTRQRSPRRSRPAGDESAVARGTDKVPVIPLLAVTPGSFSAKDWLSERGLASSGSTRWFVEVALEDRDAPVAPVYSAHLDTRFHVNIYPEEWSFFFCHGGRTSWIRVNQAPVVHQRDEFELLCATPLLRDIGPFVRALEERHAIRFRREHALIRSNVAASHAALAAWVAAL